MATFDSLRDELESRPPSHGVTLPDLLDMPEPLASVLSHLLRARVMDQAELGEELGLGIAETIEIGRIMTEKGYVTVVARADDTVEYHVVTARVRGRSVPLDF
jgi:hypothetical protein